MVKERVKSLFLKITSFPHCSGDTGSLRSYIVEFSENAGYEVEVDRAGNIAIRSEAPKVTLQAHYDMVCIGNAPDIEIFEEDGWLKGRNSSIGADNGLAIAIILALIEDGVEIEAIITNDEEIGLLGANGFELDITTDRFLNLDSEDIGTIFIGSAGGRVLEAKLPIKRESIDSGYTYRASISDLPGGHSGVDIDKGILSAIDEVLKRVSNVSGFQLVSINGGERINSISTSAEIVFRSDERLKGFEALDSSDLKAVVDSEKVMQVLNQLDRGVILYNSELSIPEVSNSLGLIETTSTEIKLTTFIRAMDNANLFIHSDSIRETLTEAGFSVDILESYPAWKPEKSQFFEEVFVNYRAVYGKEVEITAIHAGLETAIFKDKFPSLQIASVGPTIENPHSLRERADLESVETLYKLIRTLV